MQKEFRISLLVAIPLAVALGVNHYSEGHLISSIIVGIVGSASVFFVPYIFRRIRREKKTKDP